MSWIERGLGPRETIAEEWQRRRQLRLRREAEVVVRKRARWWRLKRRVRWFYLDHQVLILALVLGGVIVALLWSSFR